MKDADVISGMNGLRFINEAPAAAITYGLDRAKRSGDHNILTNDMSEDNLDVSLLAITDEIFEVHDIMRLQG